MAASGNAHGLSTRLYRVARISSKDLASVAAAAVSGNEILDPTGVTPPTLTRSTTARQSFTTTTDVPVPLRQTLGELTFSFILDPSEANHTALRDDDMSTGFTYIFAMIDLATPSDITYHVYDGFVTSKGCLLYTSPSPRDS